MKNILIALLFTCWVLPSYATIVDNGQYTTVNGHDWLDLSLTDGLSISEALIENPLYELANKAQFTAMFSEFYTTSPDTALGVTNGFTFVQDGGQLRLISTNWDYQNNLFQQLFGLTVSFGDANRQTIMSDGLYDDGGTTRMGGIELFNYVDPSSNDFFYVMNNLTNDRTSGGLTGRSDFGVFLIRSTSTTVPEPSVLTLMALGLLGFSVSRKKKKN